MSAPSLLPIADVGSSLRHFGDAAGTFFANLADVRWGAMALALTLYLGMLLARTAAWRNVLKAAYPRTRVSYMRLSAAYFVGAGLNGILPARIGDVVKIFLARGQIKGSSYATVTSSFFVESIFDTAAGICVLTYALTQGLLPRPPDLPDLPAFDVAFWAQHPQALLFTITFFAIAGLCAFALLARRVEAFWGRIKQGVAILSEPGRYLSQVVSWQAASWLLRFGSFWFFLEAFHIGGTIPNVLLVMSVQAISTVIPFTPGGAGAQQALLVATLEGPSRTAVLSYSVGQQVAIAAWAALLGFASLVFVFRTTKWRDLIHAAEADAAAGEKAEEAKEAASA